jgi:hypothetical protein
MGVALHHIKEKDLDSCDDVDFNCGTINDLIYSYQASYLGIEAGGENIKAYSEFGLGYQGNFSFGIKYRF